MTTLYNIRTNKLQEYYYSYESRVVMEKVIPDSLGNLF
jgi:hypothetical protein